MARRAASVSDKWQALHALNFVCQTETSRWRTVKDVVPLPHASFDLVERPGLDLRFSEDARILHCFQRTLC